MKSILLFVFLLFLFAVESSVKMEYSSKTVGDQIFTTSFNFPNYVPGYVQVSVTASYDIELCFQEYVAIKGSLTDCNKGGYLFFSANSSEASPNPSSLSLDMNSGLRFRDFDSPEKLSYFTTYASEQTNTFSAQLRLRGGSPYFLSVRYNYTSSVNTTNVWSATVEYQTPCIGQIGLPSGCSGYQNATINTNSTALLNSTSSDYYQIILPTSANSLAITAKIITSPSINDDSPSLSLFLKRGTPPTTKDYDAVSSYSSNVYTLSFDQPINGDWFLLIQNNQLAPVTVLFNTQVSVCPKNQFGPNCKIGMSNFTDLTNNYNITKQTGTGDFQYYLIKRNTLIFGAAADDTDVLGPVVRASFLNLPTNESYLVGAAGQTVNFIYSDYPDPTTEITWFIAVSFQDGEDYQVWANVNCPNLCQGDDYLTANATAHGTCDKQTGVCTCDKHYDGIGCTKSGLAVVWIVLIVIACLVVLAVAIGVPVGCYLKNKKRARYERV